VIRYAIRRADSGQLDAFAATFGQADSSDRRNAGEFRGAD
jgi:hypothetical protein